MSKVKRGWQHVLHAAPCCSALPHAPPCCPLRLHVAPCCYMLLHVAPCCSVMLHVAPTQSILTNLHRPSTSSTTGDMSERSPVRSLFLLGVEYIRGSWEQGKPASCPCIVRLALLTECPRLIQSYPRIPFISPSFACRCPPFTSIHITNHLSFFLSFLRLPGCHPSHSSCCHAGLFIRSFAINGCSRLTFPGRCKVLIGNNIWLI